MRGVGDALEALLNDDVTAAVFALEGVQTAIMRMAAHEDMAMGPMPKKRRSPGKKRKASAWNSFVAVEMPKVLKAHPRFTPQRAMKEVSKRWRSSPKNPNRRRRKR